MGRRKKKIITYEDRRWCVTTLSSGIDGQSAIKCVIRDYKEDLFVYYLSYSYLMNEIERHGNYKSEYLNVMLYLYNELGKSRFEMERVWEVTYEWVEQLISNYNWHKHSHKPEDEKNCAWNSSYRCDLDCVRMLEVRHDQSRVSLGEYNKWFTYDDG